MIIVIGCCRRDRRPRLSLSSRCHLDGDCRRGMCVLYIIFIKPISLGLEDYLYWIEYIIILYHL